MRLCASRRISPASGKSCGRVSQQDAIVEHAVGDAVGRPSRALLHRREVARRVATGERDPCDEVMKDELVQDDDAGPAARRTDDPAVRVRVIPYVVEGDVGLRTPTESARARDLDVDPLPQRGEEQRAVVGDAQARGRARRVVGDLHARGDRWRDPGQLLRDLTAGLPPCARVVDVVAEPGAGFGDRGRPGLTDESRATVGDDLQRAAGVGRRDDRLLGEERLREHHAKVFVDRRVIDGEDGGRRELGEAPASSTQPENVTRPSTPFLVASSSRQAQSGPSPTTTPRNVVSVERASSIRSTRLARSRRPTESTKSPYSSR